MVPYESLYGHTCGSHIAWLEVAKRKLLGQEMVQEATSKISLMQDRLLIAKSQ